MPVIIGVNFHHVHGSGRDHGWTRPRLRHGRVQTLVDPLTRPNFRKVKKSVTNVSAMSPDMLVIAFHFSPLNVNQTYHHCTNNNITVSLLLLK